MWSSVSEGFAESNFMAFGTVLTASAGKLSLLTAYQALIGCFAQLWSERLLTWAGSRKRLVVGCVSLQTGCLALLALAAAVGATIPVFFALALVYVVVGSFSGSVWNSWVSELLPSRRRGFCFGYRNQRTYPACFAAMLAGGFILQQAGGWLPGAAGMRWGFFAIFALGFFAKARSAWHLSLQPDSPRPPEAVGGGSARGPLDLVASCARDVMARRLLLFFGIFGFSVGISAAFTTPYLLNELRFSFVEFTVASAMLMASRFLVAPLLGARLDESGARRMLVWAALAMPLVSIGWAVSRSFAAILLTQAVAGVIWTAYDLATFAYLAERTSPRQRTAIFSARQLVWSLATFLGAGVGAWIGTRMGEGRACLLVFWLSALGRLIAPWALLAIPQEAEILAESPTAAGLGEGGQEVTA